MTSIVPFWDLLFQQHAINKCTGVLLACLFMISCSSEKKGAVNGKDLKGDDALAYLAGEEGKTWKLQKGHDYYEYLHFSEDLKAMFQAGISLRYEVDGDSLVLKDYMDFKYNLLRLSKDTFTMIMPGNDTLMYVTTKDRIEEGKPIGNIIDEKWLKGKYGTVWRFEDSDKFYSFMNDGTIVNPVTKSKVDDWKIKDKTFSFGPSNLAIYRLTPVYFDYEIYGSTVKMIYQCEANKDGSPVNKDKLPPATE